MQHLNLLCFIFLTITTTTTLSLSSAHPHHFLNHHHPFHLRNQPPIESIELGPPPYPTAPPTPKCTLSLLSHSFANTYNLPPATAAYSPPPSCPPPWSRAELLLSGAVSGEQYDRIAAVWLSGAEILRTSTPEPFASGTFWNIRKDITKYSSLLSLSNVSLSMMLENLVNDVFTGVIHVNLTLQLYKERNLGLGLGLEKREKPADLVIPVGDDGDRGHWFHIESETNSMSKNVSIPMNAYKIVVELYVSFHGDDEFWYSNPPNSYISANNLSISRGNGAFRDVFVKIDGGYIDSVVPIPLVFTGGVNPLFWEPVVGIGAFNLPSYEFELTSSLGSLLDGKSHRFEFGVTNALQFWLVDANLHVWVDKGLSKVEAGRGFYEPPEFRESWNYNFKELDGLFHVEARRKSRTSGWVARSCGNVTTTVARELKFKNSIRFRSNGSYKIVKQKLKLKTKVVVVTDVGAVVSERKFKGKYPLDLIISTVPGRKNGTNLMKTNISLGANEKFVHGQLVSSVSNSQESRGWMLVKDHDVLSGEANTQQTVNYRDNSGCFVRSVEATRGKIIRDDSSSVCPSIFGTMINVLFGTW